MVNTCKPTDYPIMEAARSIIQHYEGEAWKWKLPRDDFPKRVHVVANIIAAALRAEQIERPGHP